MPVNNFKELEKEIVSTREARIQKVHHNIVQTRSLFQTIGDVVELYFPNVVDMFVRMSGDQKIADNVPPSKYPHENSEQ
jgi:hypothetical protein